MKSPVQTTIYLVFFLGGFLSFVGCNHVLETSEEFSTINSDSVGCHYLKDEEAAYLNSDLRFSSSISNDMPTVRITNQAFDIVSPNLMPVVGSSQVSHQVQIESKPGGFDLVVHFFNSTDQEKAMGILYMPGLRLQSQVSTIDFRAWRGTGREFSLDLSRSEAEGGNANAHGNFFGGAFYYPNDSYSPVAAIKDSTYAVGMSFLYDVVAYDHFVRIQTQSPGGQYLTNGRSWMFQVELLDSEGRLAKLPARTSRTYRMAIRILETKSLDSKSWWLRLLLPYRDHFRSKFGDPIYKRDGRPVIGISQAMNEACSPSSPFGYLGTRPDLNGWTAFRKEVEGFAARGWPRAMMWTPSGVYCSSQNNYPSLMLSPMMDRPVMARSVNELAALSEIFSEIGYWNGRASTVDEGWDTGRFHSLDPDNANDRAFFFREISYARSLGAKSIGLDAYEMGHRGPGKAFRWMKSIQAFAPEIKYIHEGMPSDLMHFLSPGFLDAHNSPVSLTMADFLFAKSPETWSGIRIDMMGGFEQPLASKLALIENQSRLGYTPLTWDNFSLDKAYEAKDTHSLSLPAALQYSCTH